MKKKVIKILALVLIISTLFSMNIIYASSSEGNQVICTEEHDHSGETTEVIPVKTLNTRYLSCCMSCGANNVKLVESEVHYRASASATHCDSFKTWFVDCRNCGVFYRDTTSPLYHVSTHVLGGWGAYTRCPY